MKNQIKKLSLTLLIAIFQITLASSQCCPYLGDISIIPENPSSTDSVYLITNVTTPNQGSYLGYEITEIPDNTILVKACYWEGFLTSLKDFTDTINLGILHAASYTINFTALSSNDYLICTPVDSNSVQLEFDVSGTNAVDETIDGLEIECFPNPVIDEYLFIQSNQQIRSVEFVNSIGTALFHEKDLEHHSFEINMTDFPTGVYFIKLVTQTNIEVFKKIFKS